MMEWNKDGMDNYESEFHMLLLCMDNDNYNYRPGGSQPSEPSPSYTPAKELCIIALPTENSAYQALCNAHAVANIISFYMHFLDYTTFNSEHLQKSVLCVNQ